MPNATWSTTDKTANITLSGGNLIATQSLVGQNGGVRAAGSVRTGKYYWEYTQTVGTNISTVMGVSKGGASLVSGGAAAGSCVVLQSGNIYFDGSNLGSFFGTIANGAVIGVALDATVGLIWFRLGAAGNWNNSGTANPATGFGGVSLAAWGSGIVNLYPVVTLGAQNDRIAANFGDTAFVGAVPAGFTAGFPDGLAANIIADSGLVREALITTIPAAQLSALAREVLLANLTAATISGVAREILLVGDPVVTRPGQTAVCMNMG